MQSIISIAAYVFPLLLLSVCSVSCKKCGESRFAPLMAAYAGMLLYKLISEGNMLNGISAPIILAVSLPVGGVVALLYLLIRRNSDVPELLAILPIITLLTLLLIGIPGTEAIGLLSTELAASVSVIAFFALSVLLISAKKLRLSLTAVGDNPETALDLGINTARTAFLIVLLACALSGLSGALTAGAEAPDEAIMALALIICIVSRKGYLVSLAVSACVSLLFFFLTSSGKTEYSLVMAAISFFAALQAPPTKIHR